MVGKIILISEQDTTVEGAWFDNRLVSSEQDFVVESNGTGTFTVQLETQAPNGSAIVEKDLTRTDITVSANERVPITLPYGVKTRANMTAASGTPQVKAYVIRRGERRA